MALYDTAEAIERLVDYGMSRDAINRSIARVREGCAGDAVALEEVLVPMVLIVLAAIEDIDRLGKHQRQHCEVLGRWEEAELVREGGVS
jgi:hypothetical protein